MSDIYLWIILLIMLAVVTVLDMGIVHMVWWRKCERELGKHRYSRTSNNREEFSMKVFQIKKHFWNYSILGLGMKTPPQRGDVLYLIHEEFVTTVLVKKVITEAIPDKNYYRVELRAFRHIPKKIRGEKDSSLTDVYISNRRTKAQVEPYKYFDIHSIQYPLIIRHSRKAVLSLVPIILLGLGELFLAAIAFSGETTRSLIGGLFFIALGLLFIIAGIHLHWREAHYLIRVEADGCVQIRNNGKTKDLILDTLKWGLKQTDNKPEHRTLVLFAADGTSLGELADTENGFEPLLALLREKLREMNSHELIQSIREKKWILPTSDGEPMTGTIRNDKEGTEPGLALIITDSPEHLKQNDREYRFRDISLEEAVEMTEGFTVYGEIWLLMELPSNGRMDRFCFRLKADNLEEVLGGAG